VPPGVPCDTDEFVSAHDYAEARLERIPIDQTKVGSPEIFTKERNDVLHAVRGLNSPRRGLSARDSLPSQDLMAQLRKRHLPTIVTHVRV